MSLKVFLAGPISHWWTCWDSPEHLDYVERRDALHAALVYRGCLCFRPDLAWKGDWDELAQPVNDAAMDACNIIVDMTPTGVISHGTLREIQRCRDYDKTVVKAPADPHSGFPVAMWAESLASAIKYSGSTVVEYWEGTQGSVIVAQGSSARAVLKTVDERGVTGVIIQRKRGSS